MLAIAVRCSLPRRSACAGIYVASITIIPFAACQSGATLDQRQLSNTRLSVANSVSIGAS